MTASDSRAAVTSSRGYLIFDLDGTLSDPLRGMAASINYALTHCGYSAQGSSSLAQYVGPPLEGTFQALVNDLDAATQTRLISLYREHYNASGFAQNTVYPGIRDLLNRLTEIQQPLGVCTAKPESIARKVLRHFSLESYFDFVSGGDIGVTKVQQLEHLLLEGTIDRSAMMVGDRGVDMIAACSNGLQCCGVTWGYGSYSELIDAGADSTIDNPGEILGLPGYTDNQQTVVHADDQPDSDHQGIEHRVPVT